MSYATYLARRLGFAVLSVYIAVTLMFALTTLQIRLILQKRIAIAEWAGATEQEIDRLIAAFRQRRGLNEPLHERYLDWLLDVTTFDWGYSLSYRQPVIDVIDGRVVTTLEYVIPGVLVAVALGVLLGLLSAFRRGGVADWTSRLTAYALLGIPVFMVLTYVLAAASHLDAVMHTQVYAAVAVGVSLLAGQLRFSRSAALDQTGRAFVKMLRAKGVSRVRLVRHVLRNAALPIVSLSLSELLTVLVLNIYVIEDLLRIDGLANASFRAVQQGDMALVIWTTLVIVFLGIAGSFLQDALYGYLDPQLD